MNGEVTIIPGEELSGDALDALGRLRFPIDAATGREPTISNKILLAIRHYGGTATVFNIIRATGLTYDQVTGNMHHLRKRGRVVQVSQGLFAIAKPGDVDYKMPSGYRAPIRKDIRTIKPIKKEPMTTRVLDVLKENTNLGAVGETYIADKLGITRTQAYNTLLFLGNNTDKTGVIRTDTGWVYTGKVKEEKVSGKIDFKPYGLTCIDVLEDEWFLLKDKEGNYYRAESLQLAFTTKAGKVIKTKAKL